MAVSTIKKSPNWESGRVGITPSGANVPTKATISFRNTYSKNPLVIPLVNTTVPGTGVTGVSAANVTQTSADIYVTRTNTTDTLVLYVVIEV